MSRRAELLETARKTILSTSREIHFLMTQLPFLVFLSPLNIRENSPTSAMNPSRVYDVRD
jgi:hypothetical protein